MDSDHPVHAYGSKTKKIHFFCEIIYWEITEENNEGEVVFNFGKYQNQRVIDVITKVDPNYYRWILEKDFSVQVKRTIKQIKEAHEKQKA